jgi:hypothetical protein
MNAAWSAVSLHARTMGWPRRCAANGSATGSTRLSQWKAACCTLGSVREDHLPALIAELENATAQWVERALQMQQSDVDFPSRLAGCETAAEATEVCSAWVGSRLDLAVATQHRLLALWLEAARLSAAAAPETGVSDADVWEADDAAA